jgi:hypothetical protein
VGGEPGHDLRRAGELEARSQPGRCGLFVKCSCVCLLLCLSVCFVCFYVCVFVCLSVCWKVFGHALKRQRVLDTDVIFQLADKACVCLFGWLAGCLFVFCFQDRGLQPGLGPVSVCGRPHSR